MSEWYLLRSGPGAAAWNMALDEALLENIQRLGRPVLRLYAWSEPAATFGYSQHYADVASWTALRPLIRRPTGGGLVPHDADWTYSIVVPPDDAWYKLRAEESYRRAHDWVAESFQELEVAAELARCCAKDVPGRCFIGAEKFDVLANGQKIAGAAQKRNKLGQLIQGSIQPAGKEWNRTAWEESFLRVGQARLGIQWTEIPPEATLSERASVLAAEKYSQAAYNERR